MGSRVPNLLLVAMLLAVVPATTLAQAEASPGAATSSSPAATGEPAATTGTESSPVPLPEAADPDGPVVQGVFHFSPTCPHCDHVISEHLPGIFEANGGPYAVSYDESMLPEEVAFFLMSNGRLQLLMVDTSQDAGADLYLRDADALGFDKPPGVPLLHIGDEWYVGSVDIPERLPGIVRRGLAGDGIGWPSIPGLEDALAPFVDAGTVVAIRDADSASVLPAGTDDSVFDRIGRDPLGNGISIVMLVVLVASLVVAPVLAARGSMPEAPSWFVPALAIAGAGVAVYLATVETSGGEAVCGPVGDCNAVQGSEYASLFGVHNGVLGTIGYALIIALWAVSRWGHGGVADAALVAVAAGAYGGTLFSVYLTFLEPFVIGATCMWCISSAVIMVLLLWLTAAPGWAALERLRTSHGPATAG